MKILLLILTFLIIFSCNSCFKEYSQTDSLLFKEQDVVFGVLAPDTAVNFIRNYPVEVFVGKIIPTDIKNKFHVEGMQDSVLQRIMICTRKWYITYYEYDSTAQVTINGPDKREVQLQYVGNGIYRDINNKLKIKSNTTYDLNIRKNNGKKYHSSTLIPPSIQIINPLLDTIHVVPDTHKCAFYPIYINWIDTPTYCIQIDKRSNFPEPIFIYLMANELMGFADFQYPPTDTFYTNTEVRAINDNLANFEHPAGYSFTSRFNDFMRKLETKTISEKSNIEGENVVGVFGAYNATRRNFVVIADTTKKHLSKR